MVFSKGPWSVEYAVDGSPYVESIDGSICSMGPYCGDRSGWVPEEDDKANAMLISTAPDMVDILKRIMDITSESDLEDIRVDIARLIGKIVD